MQMFNSKPDGSLMAMLRAVILSVFGFSILTGRNAWPLLPPAEPQSHKEHVKVTFL